MPLPNPTVIAYNGFTWPVEAATTAAFRFVPDAARRTVVETVLTLTVKAKVAAGATQDASLDAIRAALERPGGQLTVTGLGLGTLAINTPGGRKDLNWGPFPETLTWVNVGAGRAANVTWQCQVSLLGCLGAPDSGQVKEFTWEAVFTTDNGGYTTRTITAELKIPQTRLAVADPTVPDCADAYLERYLPVQSPGFARTITRNVSRSKSEITFTVTDTELAGYPLPDGCVAATASHTYSCEKAQAMVRWTGNLSATYEIARDRPRADTWAYFKALVADRVQRLRNRGVLGFPISLSIGEPELYGKQAGTFTLTYIMFQTGSGGQEKNAAPWVPTGGLWAAPPDADWTRHSASLANGAQAARGFVGGRVSAGNDRIVDLCVGPTPPSAIMDRRDIQPGQPTDEQWNQLKSVLGIDDTPDPAATWLDYVCVPDIEEHSRLRTHFPLPTETGGTSILRTPNYPGTPGTFPHQTDTFALAAQESPAPVAQYGGSPGYFVRLIGRALRFAYEIPRPVCPPVAGAQPVEANDPRLGTFWRSGLVGWTTHPIYAARWNLRYFVPRPLGTSSTLAPIMPHPFQQSPAPVR